jgi:cell division protein FtsZ
MSESQVPDLSAVASPPRQSLTYEDLKISEAPLGVGGQAIVYEAAISGSEPPAKVALKEPHNEQTITTEAIESFLEEANTWQTIDRREREKPRWREYEHIVGIVDTGETPFPWIAMEYMDGGGLDDRLDNAPDGLPVDEALWIGECLCRGLEIADGFGYSHLDVKPENILFRQTPEGTWDVPKLADWGVARTLAEQTGTMEAQTITYSAPEQFDPSEFGDPDSLTDLYQVGAVVYAMLTGEPPHTGSNQQIRRKVLDDGPAPPSQHRGELSEAIDVVVTEAMAKHKNDRHRGLQEFEKALRAIRTNGRLPTVIVNQIGHSATGGQPASNSSSGEFTRPDRQSTTDDNRESDDLRVVVTGTGRAGNNTINRLYNIGVEGADTVSVDTNRQHLEKIEAETKILFGESLTEGVGTDGNLSRIKCAAEGAHGTFKEVLDGADLAFVTASIGSSTGAGAAPVVSRIAKDQGAIVVGIALLPFNDESVRTVKVEDGLKGFRNEADSTIVFDSNRLLDYMPNLPVGKALSIRDQIVAETVKDISETITQPSLINLDYTDMSTIMNQDGVAVIFVGETQNQNKTEEVVDNAMNHPFFDVDNHDASGGLIIITGGPDLTLKRAKGIVMDITDRVEADADIIWSARVKEEYEGRIQVRTIMTGIQSTHRFR